MSSSVNWFLIIVVVAVAILTALLSVYIIVIYQHPEDKNQAWFPKIVVLLGLCVAIWSILLFPLDVADAESCDLNIPLSSCTFTFPMEQIWYGLYIANVVLVFAIIPFTMFYYEADSEWSTSRRWFSGILWGIGTVLFFGIVTVIPYLVAGYAVYDVQLAFSGMAPVTFLDQPSLFANCIVVGASKSGQATASSWTGYLCDSSQQATQQWKPNVSYVSYAMAIVATMGWVLFLFFGGIGLVALPFDWIRAFMGRPRSTISRAQYQERAKDLARRANDIKSVAEALKRQEREGRKNRKWRKNLNALQTQLIMLEEDEKQLELVYPQGEDPDYVWTVTVMKFWLKFIGGLLALVLSVSWFLQIILYVLISPPVTPLLNTLFIEADNFFPLIGTTLFAIFLFYLQMAVIKGAFKFGLNMIFVTIHPMKPGGTIMSSFLFNVALVLLATTASVQFASTAFALYAEGTAILDIYGNQLKSLQGLRYIYTKNIFIYAFVVVMALTVVYLIMKGPDSWKRKKVEYSY